MRKAERLSDILDQLAERGRVDVTTLAHDFGVSSATVRRDLQSLSRSQLIMRTHGGALAANAGEEVSPRLKSVIRHPQKERVGRAAAQLVPEGAVVGMTGGTTMLEVARSLAERRGLTIVTNAINVAAELAEHDGIRLIVVGGYTRQSLELVGPAAEAMLSSYHLDIAFVGVDGLTAEEGCTTYDEMEAQTDQAFLRRAGRRIVVSDSSKIGKIAFARITHLSEISDIVTDREANSEELAKLSAAGPSLVVV